MVPATLPLKGFSIREYAASMRGVNFDKCWPFIGIDKEVENKSLPQICVRKYRFWADEIVNDEQDEEKSKTRKQKALKKRSIVEIFAVSPKIKNGARKNGSRRKGKTVKKKIQVEICSATKVKGKTKTSSADISHTLKNSLRIGKKNPNDDKKKPLFMKNLAKSRTLKLLQSTKLITEKRKKQGKGSQVHSIKKSRAKDPSQISRGPDLETCANSCTHIDIPQLRSLCQKFSDVLAASSSLQNKHTINDRLEKDDANGATNTKERSNVEASPEKGWLSESCCDIAPQNFENQDDACPNAMGKKNTKSKNSYIDNQVKEPTPNTTDMFSCLDNQVRGSTSKSVELQYSQSLANNLMGKCSSRNEVDLNKRFLPSLEPVNDSSWKTVELYPAQSSRPTRKEKGTNDNFVGLPLNSQGELIDFQSGSKFGYSETGLTHPNSRNAVDFRNVTKGKFPSINVNQNEQLNSLQDPYLNIRNSAINSERFGGQNIETCQGSMQNYHTRNYIDNVNFQRDINHAPPSNDEHTMRLMGTNVIIGSENCRGRQSFGSGKRCSFDKEVIFSRQNPQYWKPQQTYQTSSNNHWFNTSSNLYPRPMFSSFENQPQWVSRNNPSANRNINRINQQFPVNYQHKMLSSTHCKHSVGSSTNTTSNIYHPFLSQEYTSSHNPTHWLWNSNLQKKSQEISCSCFRPVYQHNSGMPQMNNVPFRPPQFTSNPPLPVPTATFSHNKHRTAADKFSGAEKMYRDRMNSNITYLKGLNGSSKARKRPAVTNIDFARPKKVQLPTSVGKNVVCAESSGVVNNELMAPSGSKKTETKKSSGPVKLTAGAKHVLKPGFDINEDYPVPTHSTLTYDSAVDVSMKRSEIYRF